MRLSREERKQVFAGTLKVLRRPSKPDQPPGTEIVVSSARSRKHIVDRDSGETVFIPSQPRLWIVIKGWHLKQGSTEWETTVEIHDHREDNRQLATGIGGMPQEAGLKTRWGTKVVHRDGKVAVESKRVPKKDEQKENWTPETERGYGGGGGRGLDERSTEGDIVPATAVDDDYLHKLVNGDPGEENGIAHANIGLQTERRERERMMREEANVARAYRKGNLSGARAAKRRADEAAEKCPDLLAAA